MNFTSRLIIFGLLAILLFHFIRVRSWISVIAFLTTYIRFLYNRNINNRLWESSILLMLLIFIFRQDYLQPFLLNFQISHSEYSINLIHLWSIIVNSINSANTTIFVFINLNVWKIFPEEIAVVFWSLNIFAHLNCFVNIAQVLNLTFLLQQFLDHVNCHRRH